MDIFLSTHVHVLVLGKMPFRAAFSVAPCPMFVRPSPQECHSSPRKGRWERTRALPFLRWLRPDLADLLVLSSLTELTQSPCWVWRAACLPRVKAETLLIIPATFPQVKTFPSPFPSLFIPIPLHPAISWPFPVCPHRDHDPGPPRGRAQREGRDPQPFELTCSGSPLLGCSPLTGAETSSPCSLPSAPCSGHLGCWLSLSLSPSLTSCSLGSSLAVSEGQRAKAWVRGLGPWVSL